MKEQQNGRKTIKITAKTMEEAVAQAVKEWGVASANELEITVEQEAKKGFLGLGSAPAMITASRKAAPAAPAPAVQRKEAVPTPAPQPTPAPSPAPAAVSNPPAAKEKKDDAPARTGRVGAPIDVETASDGVRAAYTLITRLIQDMGFEGVTVSLREGDNDDTVIAVDGEAAGVLIGHHGDTQDSLQYLANLAANHRLEGEKKPYVRITLDVEHYRAKREAALRALARKKAAQVLKYKKSVMLEPMNPCERRIIHSEIQSVEGVSTNSIGTENNRRVVVFLEEKGMPSGTEKKTSSTSVRRSGGRSAGKSGGSSDPFHPVPTKKKETPALFREDDVKDPFDLDLTAAMPQEADASDADHA